MDLDVKLKLIKGPAHTQTVRLRSAVTLIGRQRGCDLRIPSAEVSRRHCTLSIANGQLTVEDLHSANGTFLNGQPVTRRQLIRPGDSLQIGPLTFAVQYQPESAHNDTEAGSPLTPAEMELEPAFELLDDQKETTGALISFQLVEGEENLELVLDDSEPLNLPQGEDLRDFLSKMDR